MTHLLQVLSRRLSRTSRHSTAPRAGALRSHPFLYVPRFTQLSYSLSTVCLPPFGFQSARAEIMSVPVTAGSLVPWVVPGTQCVRQGRLPRGRHYQPGVWPEVRSFNPWRLGLLNCRRKNSYFLVLLRRLQSRRKSAQHGSCRDGARCSPEQTRPSAAEDAVRTVQTRGSLALFPWSSQRPSLLLEPPPLLLQPLIPCQAHSLAPLLAPEKDQQSIRLLQGITVPRASGHGRPEGQKESGQNIRSGRCVLMGLPHGRWPRG